MLATANSRRFFFTTSAMANLLRVFDLRWPCESWRASHCQSPHPRYRQSAVLFQSSVSICKVAHSEWPRPRPALFECGKLIAPCCRDATGGQRSRQKEENQEVGGPHGEGGSFIFFSLIPRAAITRTTPAISRAVAAFIRRQKRAGRCPMDGRSMQGHLALPPTSALVNHTAFAAFAPRLRRFGRRNIRPALCLRWRTIGSTARRRWTAQFSTWSPADVKESTIGRNNIAREISYTEQYIIAEAIFAPWNTDRDQCV